MVAKLNSFPLRMVTLGFRGGLLLNLSHLIYHLLRCIVKSCTFFYRKLAWCQAWSRPVRRHIVLRVVSQGFPSATAAAYTFTTLPLDFRILHNQLIFRALIVRLYRVPIHTNHIFYRSINLATQAFSVIIFAKHRGQRRFIHNFWVLLQMDIVDVLISNHL